ncbi:TPA: Cro/Cl family transcriptional regulator [Aeromonas hydrophila]|uniref:Cro/CI family transcriptional regulator n=1 Tax=Aeromonas hydrophila TaxID=644 RepID=UPI002961F680|nr:Cro/CI family transcriptional regulator [Aeromonas hydrophila]HDI1213472.1 Cro/Cl family transcriptional regulator [Aeromonas hydrophila]
MQKSAVLEHFGTVTATAKALGISHVAVSKWSETIPQGRAYQIEVLTGGQLKADATAEPDQGRDTQRVDPAATPADFPCVKRAIAAASALSGSAS